MYSGGKSFTEDRVCSSTVVLGTYNIWSPRNCDEIFLGSGNEIMSPGGNIVIQAGVTVLFDTRPIWRELGRSEYYYLDFHGET
jgi:hypothetical protein